MRAACSGRWLPKKRAARRAPARRSSCSRFGHSGEAAGFLGEKLRELMQTEPRASVAVIARYPEQADIYYEALTKAEVPYLRRIADQDFPFKPGIDVTDVRQVKGLEFDYVVLVEVGDAAYPAEDEARHLLHIGATRAAHQLWVLTSGRSSPLLPEGLRGTCFLADQGLAHAVVLSARRRRSAAARQRLARRRKSALRVFRQKDVEPEAQPKRAAPRKDVPADTVENAALPFHGLRASDCQPLSRDELMAELAKFDAICIGERHDNPHTTGPSSPSPATGRTRSQAAVASSASASRCSTERTNRCSHSGSRQDRHRRADRAKRTGKATGGFRSGSIVRCSSSRRQQGSVCLALNAPRELTRHVARQGLEALDDEPARSSYPSSISRKPNTAQPSIRR